MWLLAKHTVYKLGLRPPTHASYLAHTIIEYRNNSNYGWANYSPNYSDSCAMLPVVVNWCTFSSKFLHLVAATFTTAHTHTRDAAYVTRAVLSVTHTWLSFSTYVLLPYFLLFCFVPVQWKTRLWRTIAGVKVSSAIMVVSWHAGIVIILVSYVIS